MPDNGRSEPLDPNHALLVGEIAGILAWRLRAVVEHDRATGDYTGRILIKRPSGWWAVSVEKLADDDEVNVDA